MVRILATALSACTFLAVGMMALNYRAKDLGAANMEGANATAYNLTTDVSTDLTLIAGNALPSLFALIIFVLVILMVLMNR